MLPLKTIFQKITPDLVVAFSRFPFTFVLLAGAAIIVLGNMNFSFGASHSVWVRWCISFTSAAGFSLAGYLFQESRPICRKISLFLIYGLPLICLALFELHDTTWVFTPLIPFVSVLWLSVSAFTKVGRSADRETQQDMFWWYNQRAIISAIIVALALIIFGLGLLAIETSLDVLFGLRLDDLLYHLIYPFLYMFLGPVYWLTTLPKLMSYQDEAKLEPDFISRAVGLLGQYILTPLLAIYAVILLAYAVQIAVNRALPEGTLGWMVLTFVVVGAANTLILHPPFFKEKVIVKFFKKFWFWTTLIPLGMYFIAIWIRIDQYGLTPERVLLVAGGLWASVLALCSLLPHKQDIRLVPALSAIIFAIIGIGPLNAENISARDQLNRLSDVLERADISDPKTFPVWTKADLKIGTGAISFLRSSNNDALEALISQKGFSFEENPASNSVWKMSRASVWYSTANDIKTYLRRQRAFTALNVHETPIFLGNIILTADADHHVNKGISYQFGGNVFTFFDTTTDEVVSEHDLSEWVSEQQSGDFLTNSWIDFDSQGIKYRLVLETVTLSQRNENAPKVIKYLEGQLFKSSPPSDDGD